MLEQKFKLAIRNKQRHSKTPYAPEAFSGKRCKICFGTRELGNYQKIGNSA